LATFDARQQLVRTRQVPKLDQSAREFDGDISRDLVIPRTDVERSFEQLGRGS
jgi:hypothetical protein